MTYDIEQFKALSQPESIILTQHSRKRLAERGIQIQDVCKAIRSGEIIEDYPEDFPFPSCLILGGCGERFLHVCASIHENMIYLITAYIPGPQKWQGDLKTRKDDRQ